MATFDPDEKPTVLLVDDTPEDLTLMSALLEDTYRVKVADRGDKAIKIAASDNPPDLILLDIMMPEMDGYEVCRVLKSSETTRGIPVIFLAAKMTLEDEQKGLAAGAVDYLIKPVFSSLLLARVAAQIALKANADWRRMRDEFLRDKNDYLEQQVTRRTHEVMAVLDVTILAMTSLAETRDSDTGNHIRRTQHYVQALARHLKTHVRFANELSDAAIDVLFKAAPLHDIGKVGIPDRILLKPAQLTPEEFEIMKTHTTLGCDAIQQAEQIVGTRVDFLRVAKEIALSHQEKWDGRGYPQGLAGDDIPLSARLMAVADVYDALISERVYKAAMPHDRAVGVVFQGRGAHFDPDMVDAFIEIQSEFQAIAQRFSDTDSALQKKMEYMANAIAEAP